MSKVNISPPQEVYKQRIGGMRWTTVTDGKFLQKSVNASKELFGSSSAADFSSVFSLLFFEVVRPFAWGGYAQAFATTQEE